MGISHIKKRDGTLVRFRTSKIASVIEKAMYAVGKDEEDLPRELAERVVSELNKKYPSEHVPDVEEIQDVVEKVLISSGQAEMAKAYILYREKRAAARKVKKSILGKIDDSKLGVNGLLIAKSRYLLKDKENNAIETPREMFTRVAKAVAAAETEMAPDAKESLEEEFYDMMSSLEFIPGGRILANAGKKNNMLYSSFVIPVTDSMRGIFRALYHKALVQRLGGGTGFSFSQLRPKGSKLASTSGYASGPIAFIKLFDHASEMTVQVGNRKAANMGSLSVEHPDIIQFITMKERGEINNFNISVEITDEFMDALKNNRTYTLKDPKTGEVIDEADAMNIFYLIVTMAWKTGDPGVLFIDRINESNTLPGISRIETTDPCGDQLLLPYEAGNLGAINLSQFVKNKKIRWKHLEETTKLAVRFLDNIVDISKFPIKKIDDMVKGGRKIGLGVMGFADMLYRLEIPYDSEKALQTADKVMKFISNAAYEASEELASEKGVFPFWEKSIYKKEKRKIRNSSLLAIAPTGSRSIFADTSAGIEPNFALGYSRKIMGNHEIVILNQVIEESLKEHELYSDEIVRQIISSGNIDKVDLPKELKKVFVTAYDITPEWHIKIQSVFQKYIDNAISKTVNFNRKATIDDIKNAFILAYDLGCKGLTVYREGSLNDEVISVGQ